MASHAANDHSPNNFAARAGIETIKHPTLGTYIFTFVALLILLAVTVGLYYVDISAKLGWVGWNVLIALVVAVTKAALVVLNFMNVKGGTRLVWLWAALGWIWLLLLGGIFLDYQWRHAVSLPGWD